MIQRHLLDKSSESLKLPMMPLDDYAEVLFELGFNTQTERTYTKPDGEVATYTSHQADDFDTNGWQIDFWWGIESKEFGKYNLQGSLWYGNFQLTLIKDEKRGNSIQ